MVVAGEIAGLEPGLAWVSLDMALLVDSHSRNSAVDHSAAAAACS